jgi:hypothetical protein
MESDSEGQDASEPHRDVIRHIGQAYEAQDYATSLEMSGPDKWVSSLRVRYAGCVL